MDPLLEGLPSETLLASWLTTARATTNPTSVAIATPAMKEAESFSGFEAVTKMIAAMICGPAIIVMASGRMSRFIGS
jgi:hypothetical protein